MQTKLPWLVRGDVDGFFGLALDNLVQLIVITSLCSFVLGFPPEILFGHVFPGVAVSLLIGNLFYAHQARKVALSTGNVDTCALPYGINTPSLFLYVFLVMAPAKGYAESAMGMNAADAAAYAWRMGLLACLGSAIIECVGSLFIDYIRKFTPRCAMLSTLAGIALGFIAMPFLFEAFAYPIVALIPFLFFLVIYFGKFQLKGGLPGGMVAVILGTVLAWIFIPAEQRAALNFGQAPGDIGFYVPLPVFGDIMQAFGEELPSGFYSVVLAMGLFNVLGSLQNIESAEAAGDSYAARLSLLMNGVGSFGAACFGSCFPTTIYIGHPGWKAMGSRSGYSTLNALFFTAICLTGSLSYITFLVPTAAVVGIVIWIGIVISSQAFQSTPRLHAPAVVVGLLPGIAAWGAHMSKSGLRTAQIMNQSAGVESAPALFSDGMVSTFTLQQIHISGAFAIEQGALFLAMILAAFTAAVLERRLFAAAIWCFVASALSLCGLMHSYAFTFSDVVMAMKPAYRWAIAYAIMGLICLVLPKVSRRRIDGDTVDGLDPKSDS